MTEKYLKVAMISIFQIDQVQTVSIKLFTFNFFFPLQIYVCKVCCLKKMFEFNSVNHLIILCSLFCSILLPSLDFFKNKILAFQLPYMLFPHASSFTPC